MSVKSFGKRGAAAPACISIQGSRSISSAPAFERASDDEELERLFAATPFLTGGLIFGLLAIFMLERAFAFDVGQGATLSLESLIGLGGASFDLVVRSGEIWRLFLVPLLHASAVHLIGDMVALFLIGWRLETLIGHCWFAAIFAASALAGSTTSIVFNPHDLVGVGASGAILGLVAALFVMSFHPKVDPKKRKVLIRRAAAFGGPALAPLLFGGGHDGVDYFAHLGGALCGGAMGFRLATTWTGEAFRPAFPRQAGRFALAALAVSIGCCLFIPSHYAALAAKSRRIIPMADFDRAGDLTVASAADLLEAYPDDPRGRVLLAIAETKAGALSEAEDDLRVAMVQKWPERPGAERVEQLVAQAMLAQILSEQHLFDEAIDLARAPCADPRIGPARTLLWANGLCGTPAAAKAARDAAEAAQQWRRDFERRMALRRSAGP